MNFSEYRDLLNEKNAVLVRDSIKAFQAEYGENWLAEFKRQNPNLIFIVDIVANYNFSDAFLQLKAHIFSEIEQIEMNYFAKLATRQIAETTLNSATGDLERFHNLIKAEIDKPRF